MSTYELQFSQSMGMGFEKMSKMMFEKPSFLKVPKIFIFISKIKIIGSKGFKMMLQRPARTTNCDAQAS